MGGAAARLAEATIFFGGVSSESVDVIVASAAFRFLVMGGIVTVVPRDAAKRAQSTMMRRQKNGSAAH